MRVEFHVHSNHSDGLMDVKQIIKRAKSAGLDAIAITDHNTFSAIREAKRTAKRSGIMLIPGAEIETKHGEILVYGVESVNMRRSYHSLIDEVHENNGVVVAAHPLGWLFRRSFSLDAIREVDAIEAINGHAFNSSNQKAADLAIDYEKPVIAGSDAHMLDEIGMFACSVGANDLPGILKSIKKGKVILPRENTSARFIVRRFLERRVRRLIE